MLNNPLVSVIIPVYKVEKYLNRCVDSVLAQTYTNIEIILVDDGSPDNCGNICDHYQKKDTRIHVLHKKNGGLSDARNAGFDISNGDYVTFIDSDDYVEASFIEQLLENLIKHNADIIECGYIKGEKTMLPNSASELVCTEFTSEQFLRNWHGKYKNFETTAWGKLYRKEVFIDKDGEKILYPVGRLHEDILTTHRLVENAEKIVVLNRALYHYTINSSGITKAPITRKRLLDYIFAQEQRLDFFEKSQYKSAYKRLFVLTAQGWILYYCMGKKCLKKDFLESQDIRNRFLLNYNGLMKTGAVDHKILFFIFKYFPAFTMHILFPVYMKFKNI